MTRTSASPLVPLPDTLFSKPLKGQIPTTGTEGQSESESNDSGWDGLVEDNGRKRKVVEVLLAFNTDGRTLKRGARRKSGSPRVGKSSFMRIHTYYQTMDVSAFTGPSAEKFDTRITEAEEVEKVHPDRYYE